MAGVRLYELTQARDILDLFLVEAEGEETPEIAALFAQLEGDINRKVEDTALWLKEREADAAAIRAEEQRLAARRRTIENRVERTKHYLQFQLEQLGRDKINGLLVTVALQNNAAKLEGELTETELACLDGAAATAVKLVPATFILDRAAALKLLKSGQTIPGLSIMQTRSLRIR